MSNLTVHKSLMSLDGFTRYLDGKRYESSIYVSPDDVSQLPEQSQVKQLANSTFLLSEKERKKDHEPRGTGFFISSDGLAVVAKHCVTDNMHLHIPLRGALFAHQTCIGNTQAVKYLTILQVHEKQDVALVKVHLDSEEHTKFLALDPNFIKAKSSIFKCGFPGAYNSTKDIHLSQKRIVAGITEDSEFDPNKVVKDICKTGEINKGMIEDFVSGHSRMKGTLTLLDHEIAQSGYSGCPIVDESLKIRAVQTGYSLPFALSQKLLVKDGYKSCVFGIQTKHVIEMLDDLKIDHRELVEGEPALRK